VLDGSSWVKNETVRSASWSTQNTVLAAPPQEISPAEPVTLPGTGSIMTAKPRPKPTPRNGASANSGRPNVSRSTPPGRWLRVM
jgi:hypothetical protein